VVGAALESAAEIMDARRDLAWRRQAIVEANPELRERELIKLATLAVAIADALRGRGVPDPAASLAAEAGIAVFKIAFQRWVDEADGSGKETLAQLVRQSLAELKTVASG
jgi:hypothetical protein